METPSARSGDAGGRERQGVSRGACSVICGQGEGTRTAFLVAGEVMEVVHDGATQMAEHEPEDGLEDFLGCRRHAGRVSQVAAGSRIIVNGAGGTAILRHKKGKSKPAPLNTTRVRHPKAFGS